MKKGILMFVALFFVVVFINACEDDKKEETSDTCGNGIVDEGELCELGDTLGCDLVPGDGYHGGAEATCAEGCMKWDVADCEPIADNKNCGDGTKQDGELCEIGDSVDCGAIGGYKAGTSVSCNTTCDGYDTTSCEGYDACKAIFTCSLACGTDTVCQDSCYNQGSVDGRTKFTSLDSCMEASCPTETGNDLDNCLIEKCETQYYNCMPSEKCGNGNLDSGEICDKDHDYKIPCESIEDGDYKALNDAICDSSCEGYDTYDCVLTSAYDCSQIVTCVDACASGDSSCELQCKQKGYIDSQAAYAQRKSCMTTNCASATDLDSCMIENCLYQRDNCITHETCGNGTVDVNEVCETGEKGLCGDVANPLYELEKTVETLCNSTCTDLALSFCNGIKSCGYVMSCIEACGDDAGCKSDCKSEGSQRAQGLYSNVVSQCENCTGDGCKCDEAKSDCNADSDLQQ